MRTLNANEIEVRIGQINEKGATLLLYKDARADMTLLDEMGKPWKREHQLIDGKLFCTVSIWNDHIQQWESRQDVGTESHTEKEKGQASDSFKRACVNWGIGRELYSAPFIWISADKYTSYKNPNTGKLGTYDKFKVTHIAYDDNREITKLTIKNDSSDAVVFSYPKTTKSPPKAIDSQVAKLAQAKGEIMGKLQTKGFGTAQQKAAIQTVLKKPTVDNLEEANEVLQALEDGII